MTEKLARVENVIQNIEYIDELLLKNRGMESAPIEYVVRYVVMVPGELLPIPQQANPGLFLLTHDKESFRRSWHGEPDFNSNNRTVWGIIHDTTHDGPAWNWESIFDKFRDRHANYLEFRDNSLREYLKDKIGNKIDVIIENTFFDGKERDFYFKTIAYDEPKPLMTLIKQVKSVRKPES